MAKPQSSKLDVDVGVRVRERRVILGMTQQQLADVVGVSYQQIHKYETGINRISAGRLAGLAVALSVSVGDLFAPLADAAAQPDRRGISRLRLDIARGLQALTVPQLQAVAQTVRTFRHDGAEETAGKRRAA